MKRPKTYNHGYTFAFEMAGSKHPEGADLTIRDFRHCIITRLNAMTDKDGTHQFELFDSFCEQDDEEL